MHESLAHILNLRHLSTSPLVSHVMCLSFSGFACLAIWMWSRQNFRELSKQQRGRKNRIFCRCCCCVQTSYVGRKRICHIIWMCFAFAAKKKNTHKKWCLCAFDSESEWLHPSLLLICSQEKDGKKKTYAKYSKLMHWWRWRVCVERMMHFMENRQSSSRWVPGSHPATQMHARSWRSELVKNAFWCCFHLSELIHKSKS